MQFDYTLVTNSFRRGLDGTVETALRVVALYTPTQSRPRFILRPQKNRTSSLQVRVEGIRGTTSAKILGQTVWSSAVSFVGTFVLNRKPGIE